MKYIFWFLFFFLAYVLGQLIHSFVHFRFSKVTPTEYYVNAWKEHFWWGNVSPSPRDVIIEECWGSRGWSWDVENRWRYQGTKPSKLELWLTGRSAKDPNQQNITSASFITL